MIRSSYLIRKIRWVAMETDWLSDDILSVRGWLWLTGGVQLITFKCSRIISVPQWLKHGGKLHRASHSQLEKTRGHECSSMGKLCSCSWHSALMVSLEDGKSSRKYTFLSIIVASTRVFLRRDQAVWRYTVTFFWRENYLLCLEEKGLCHDQFLNLRITK